MTDATLKPPRVNRLDAAVPFGATFLMRPLEGDYLALSATDMAAKSSGTLRQLFNFPRELLLVVGLAAGGTTVFHTLATPLSAYGSKRPPTTVGSIVT